MQVDATAKRQLHQHLLEIVHKPLLIEPINGSLMLYDGQIKMTVYHTGQQSGH